MKAFINRNICWVAVTIAAIPIIIADQPETPYVLKTLLGLAAGFIGVGADIWRRRQK